jgi:beta-lactamase class A
MNRRRRFLAWLLLFCGLACAQSTVGDLLEQKLAEKIRKLDDSLDGVLGVAAIDLATGRTISYNGGVSFPQASSIKVPILIQVFRAARAGEIRWEDSVTLREKDLAGGSGHLQERVKKGPVTLTIRELARAMIEDSDNLATNKLIDMTGMERVNQMLEELGLWGTRLQRRMMDSAAAARDEENISTPIEMARLVETIYRGRAVDEAASTEMLALMKLVKADFRKAVPAKIEVASKPGDVPGVHCESGVVFLPKRPFVLSVMSTLLGEGANPVPEVVSLVYAHFEKLDASNRYGNRLQ